MCEDGVTVVLEFIIQTAESCVNSFLRYLLDWADAFLLGQFTRNYTQTTKRGLLTTNKG